MSVSKDRRKEKHELGKKKKMSVSKDRRKEKYELSKLCQSRRTVVRNMNCAKKNVSLAGTS